LLDSKSFLHIAELDNSPCNFASVLSRILFKRHMRNKGQQYIERFELPIKLQIDEGPISILQNREKAVQNYYLLNHQVQYPLFLK
jgi:hypothetical protein